jgi:hypothetical protein
MKTLLYIHGMGGGGDSRIPNHLKWIFDPEELRVVIRTYDFDPELGRAQIAAWVEEVKPDLVVGESLGAAQALRVEGVPHLFVSPSLGGPENLYRRAPVALFALGRWYLHHLFPVKEGDRQPLKFRYKVMRKYKAHWEAAKAAIDPKGYYFAFFGKYDHYKRSGVVSVEKWTELFGKESFAEYPGSHFMEPEFIESLLVPKIREILALEK